MAAQAIHAALEAFEAAPPDTRSDYLADGHGHVIVLAARNEGVLQAAYARARDLGLPCCLFHDGDRPEAGPTALGIGPVVNGAASEITKRFSLM